MAGVQPRDAINSLSLDDGRELDRELGREFEREFGRDRESVSPESTEISVAADDNSKDPRLLFFMGVEGFEELGRLPFEDCKYSRA